MNPGVYKLYPKIEATKMNCGTVYMYMYGHIKHQTMMIEYHVYSTTYVT